MTTKTKERPILFNSEMILALLDGRKTQTRRLVKPQPEDGSGIGPCHYSKTGWAVCELNCDETLGGCYCSQEVKCPFGFPGERLYVRESARIISEPNDTYHAIQYKADKAIRSCRETNDPVFSCAGTFYKSTKESKKEGSIDVWPWSPAMHVPKWAIRIKLEITGVRVERLQEISEEDAKSEGITRDIPFVVEHENTNGPFSYHFAALWDSIYGKPLPIYERGEDGKTRIVRYESYPWSEASRDPREEIKGVSHVCTPNPYLWVIEFKRIDN